MRKLRVLGAAMLLAACGPHTTIRATSAGTVPVDQSGAIAPLDAGPPPDSELPAAWIWRVSGGDADAPSYVLGTMHVGVRMHDALPPPYDGYLHASRALVMEVDFREVQRYLAESAGAHHGTAHHGTLDRALGRESWQRLLAEMGTTVPSDTLRRVPPGTMTLYLMQVRMAEVEAIAEGREPVRGVPSTARLDSSMAEWAIQNSCPIVALETPEQALSVLDDVLPETDVLTQLHRIVDAPDDARAEAAELRNAYLAFDETALLTAMGAHMTQAEHDAVLVGRNRAWQAALFPQIQQGGAFVAVGVGHLLGEGSVLEALAAQGYTVERLGPTSAR